MNQSNKAIIHFNDGVKIFAIDMNKSPDLKNYLMKIWAWRGVKSIEILN